MEKASQSDTEKSTLNSIKCEGFAHCLLRWQRRDGSWVFARRSIRNNALKMRVVYVKRYEEKARVCRKIIYGFCITIIQLFTHRLSVIFWPKTTTVYHAYNRRTHRTWPPATFSRFQNWKVPWNDRCLPLLKRQRPYRWRSSRPHQKTHIRSDSDWKKRWHKCIISEEITSKGTKYIFMNK